MGPGQKEANEKAHVITETQRVTLDCNDKVPSSGRIVGAVVFVALVVVVVVAAVVVAAVVVAAVVVAAVGVVVIVTTVLGSATLIFAFRTHLLVTESEGGILH